MDFGLIDKVMERLGPNSPYALLLIVLALAIWFAYHYLKLRRELALTRQEEAKVPRPEKPKKVVSPVRHEDKEIMVTLLGFLAAIVIYRITRAWTVGLDVSREHLMQTIFFEVTGFAGNVFVSFFACVFTRTLVPILSFFVPLLLLFGFHIAFG